MWTCLPMPDTHGLGNQRNTIVESLPSETLAVGWVFCVVAMPISHLIHVRFMARFARGRPALALRTGTTLAFSLEHGDRRSG